jgi:outer membrane scaffolding protein for murein synthesis (MipA/OmpV family)
MKVTGKGGAFVAIGMAMLVARPALAAADADHPYGKDSLTIGVGAALLPAYEGSARVQLSPAWGVRGQVSGFYFSSLGTSLYVDLIREAPDKLDLQLGPVIGANFNRHSRTHVDQVDALGRLDAAVEAGGFIGVGKTGVLTGKYDSISVRVSYQHDIAGAYKGYTINPSIRYGTPLSKRAYVGLSAGADIVGSRYANYYFGVTPAGAAASGLPQYALKGGLKSYGFRAIAARALGPKLSKGWVIFAAGGYTRMVGDFKRSPIVAVAGDPSSFVGALGVGYTF